MKTLLYIYGKGGNASESTHYERLFPNFKVIGLDYKTFSPWETGKEIHDAVVSLKTEFESIILIANSIGAFFSMNANLNWQVPTSIIYGENDNLTSLETIKDFSEKQGASLTVMKGGEHWFHTEEEMKFLDEWIRGQSVFTIHDNKDRCFQNVRPSF